MNVMLSYSSETHQLGQLSDTFSVILTEPYIHASNNRWTSPQLDADKKALETDQDLRLAVAKLKHKFVTETQALLHADLHTGSLMCSPEVGKTFVIDPEFAFYGPIAFDIGLLIANLMLSYVSQPAHADAESDMGYGEWILEQVETYWTSFESTFRDLWNDPSQHTGYMYERSALESDDHQLVAQQAWFADMLKESLAFCGCEMIRRVVGIAHVEDLESISDVDLKAKCERHALEVAKVLIKEPSRFETIADATALARSLKP